MEFPEQETVSSWSLRLFNGRVVWAAPHGLPRKTLAQCLSDPYLESDSQRVRGPRVNGGQWLRL